MQLIDLVAKLLGFLVIGYPAFRLGNLLMFADGTDQRLLAILQPGLDRIQRTLQLALFGYRRHSGFLHRDLQFRLQPANPLGRFVTPQAGHQWRLTSFRILDLAHDALHIAKFTKLDENLLFRRLPNLAVAGERIRNLFTSHIHLRLQLFGDMIENVSSAIA